MSRISERSSNRLPHGSTPSAAILRSFSRRTASRRPMSSCGGCSWDMSRKLTGGEGGSQGGGKRWMRRGKVGTEGQGDTGTGEQGGGGLEGAGEGEIGGASLFGFLRE